MTLPYEYPMRCEHEVSFERGDPTLFLGMSAEAVLFPHDPGEPPLCLPTIEQCSGAPSCFHMVQTQIYLLSIAER
jgi:hypothetical protein